MGLLLSIYYVPSTCGYLLSNSHSISRWLSLLRCLVALCSAYDGEGITSLLQVPQVCGPPPAPQPWVLDCTANIPGRHRPTAGR